MAPKIAAPGGIGFSLTEDHIGIGSPESFRALHGNTPKQACQPNFSFQIIGLDMQASLRIPSLIQRRSKRMFSLQLSGIDQLNQIF